MIVYQLTNKVNSKKYIGITTQELRQRMNEHFSGMHNISGQSNKFNAAKKKYGRDSFDIKVLAECNTKEELLQTEVELINKYKPEYNLTPGGEVGCLGYRWSDDKKKRFSDYRKSTGNFKGKNNPNFGRTGNKNAMAKPEVKMKWIIAMEKRGYNMENSRRKLLGGTS